MSLVILAIHAVTKSANPQAGIGRQMTPTRSNWKDHLTRGAFIAAGMIAAAVFTLQGQADILPPLALGGLVGACVVGGFQRSED